jgi:1-acyl-sn-glycerol-3-phosphate acyltransferase
VSEWPVIGERLPRRGSRAMRAVGRATLWLLRFRIEGEVPDIPKLVMAAAPHTSNWDFVVGAAVMFALDLRLSFIGKHTIFVWPFDAILRWMGGIPVNRASAHGVVGDSVAAFRDAEARILVIAPEGTRKHVEHFRMGFLHIARGAGVPILLVAFDYRARCVRLGPVVDPGDDAEADRDRIEAYYATVHGRHPR